MSGLPRCTSRSSESRTCLPFTGVDDTDVEQVRNYIRDTKSLGCSPDDTSATSTKEEVSESFVDSLTKEEIEEFRKKLYSFWEKSTQTTKTSVEKIIQTEDEPKVEVESKVALHQKSEEVVTSFEESDSEVVLTTEGLRDVLELIESELKNIRDTKLSEDYVGKTKVGKLHRSENMDFTELKKKAADLPVSAGFASTELKRKLPVLSRTDPLELLLRIYDADPASTLQHAGTSETTNQEFQKSLVIEMRFLCFRLIGAPRERVHSILEESEGETSSSTPQTKSFTLSSTDPSTTSSSRQSNTEYPGETSESASTHKDDTISSTTHSSCASLSGLVNNPKLIFPADAKKQSTAESGNSNSTTSSMNVCSDDTLSNISSLPTDTGGTRSSVSSSRDDESLTSAMSKVLPKFQIEDATDDDAFFNPTKPLATGDAGTYLTVPPVLGMASSDSSENAKAEDLGNGRFRRERSPNEDESEKGPKRQAL